MPCCVHKVGSKSTGARLSMTCKDQRTVYMFLLVVTEIPVHNGSPRRENLPDTARDSISNAPAESAFSAELRRSRVQLQSQSTCQKKYSVYSTE